MGPFFDPDLIFLFLLLYQVPGRMGMLVTLYLISANGYNSLDAPASRGFSYIEIWMIGSQFPILLALIEYGIILHLKKRGIKTTVVAMDPKDSEKNFEEKLQRLDYITMIISLSFFVLFTLFYWAINA